MDKKEIESIESKMLNTIIEDEHSRTKVLPILSPQHFSEPDHKKIMAAIQGLDDEGSPITSITVKRWIEKHHGGQGWAVKVACLDTDFLSSNPNYYATILIENSARIALHKRLESSLSRLKEGNDDIFDIVESIENTIDEGIKDAVTTGVKSFEDIKQKSKHEIQTGETDGVVLTGLTNLDELTNGFRSGNLIVIGARPGMGKSALMNTIARNIASTGLPTYMFSLEMEDTELVDRMVSADVGIDNGKIINRQLDEYERDLYLSKIDEVPNLPIYIYDKGGLTMRELKSKARLAKKTTGIGALFVDYIQLMEGSGQNREQEVSKISRDLKALAKELKIPVVALAQLSRKVEEAHYKLPDIHHLRESGAIEQDADMIMFLWRPDAYGYRMLDFDPITGEEVPTEVGETDAYVRVAKNRKGKLGNVHLQFQGRFTRFI